MNNFYIVTPTFNDWRSLNKVLQEIDKKVNKIFSKSGDFRSLGDGNSTFNCVRPNTQNNTQIHSKNTEIEDIMIISTRSNMEGLDKSLDNIGSIDILRGSDEG